jgi:hypothetical protein
MPSSSGADANLGQVGFRAIFEPSSQSSPNASDLSAVEATLSQLDALFRVAWAIADADTIRLEAEFCGRYGERTGGETLVLRPFPPAPPLPEPVVRALTMRSPLEIVAALPSAFVVASAAVAALGVLIERVLNLPLRIRVHRERLLAEKARYEAERSESEIRVIRVQAVGLEALGSSQLRPRAIELFELRDDTGSADAGKP